MITPTITVIPGDGIGPEVTESAARVIEALRPDISLDFLDHVNAGTYRKEGTALSDRDFARIKSSAATLLGAVGEPDLDETDYVRSVLMRLRADLDLYANYRPVKLWHDRLSPLRDPAARRIDCAIVRENTEGLYSGIGGALRAFSTGSRDRHRYQHPLRRLPDYRLRFHGRPKQRMHGGQGQRGQIRRTALAGMLASGGRQGPAVARLPPVRGCRRDEAGHQSGRVRRHRHQQLLWGHPQRSHRRASRRNRPGRVGQPQPGHWVRPIRARTRFGAGHHGS